MTDRRRAILQYIYEYWIENWTSPSVREITEAVGLKSKASGAWHLEVLVEQGYLQRLRLSGRRVLYRLTDEALDRIVGRGV